MKSTMRKLYITIFFMMLSFVQPFQVNAYFLELNSQKGVIGEIVTYELSIDKSPNNISAFGLDLKYDPKILDFQSFERGDLVKNGFSLFDANKISNGCVRIGGVDLDKKFIPKNKTGTLIVLKFKVVGKGDCILKPEKLLDDLSSFDTKSGSFEINTNGQ